MNFVSFLCFTCTKTLPVADKCNLDIFVYKTFLVHFIHVYNMIGIYVYECKCIYWFYGVEITIQRNRKWFKYVVINRL